MQIHAGSKWIIVGGPADFPFQLNSFVNMDLFLPEFVNSGSLNERFIHPEAILLTEGMGM